MWLLLTNIYQLALQIQLLKAILPFFKINFYIKTKNNFICPMSNYFSFKKLSSIAILSLLVLVRSLPTFAQEKWDLQKCLNYAADNNVQLKIAGLPQEANQANLIQSRMQLFPNLNAGAGQSYQFGRNIDPFTNQFTSDPVRSNNFFLGANATIFNGFRQMNTIKQNKVILEASTYDYQQARNDMSLNVVNAYIQIIFNRELLGVARLQLQNTQEQLDRVLKQIEAGSAAEVAKYDLLSQQANNQVQITTAENNLAFAFLRLKQLLQIPMEQPFDVVVPEIPEPNEDALVQTAQAIWQIAEGNQPNIKSADLNIRAGELGVDLAKGNAYPNLTANAQVLSGYSSQGVIRSISDQGLQQQIIGFLTDTPTQTVSTLLPKTAVSIERNPWGSQVGENLRQSVGLNLNIPIFNRWQVKNGVANAKIQLERSKLQSQNIRNQVRQTIEQAYNDARASSRTYASNKIRVNSLVETFRVEEQRLQVGAGNSFTFAIARNNLNIAQSELVRSKYEFVFRMKILDFYAGRELKF
jgi:outer membrane protein